MRFPDGYDVRLGQRRYVVIQAQRWSETSPQSELQTLPAIEGPLFVMSQTVSHRPGRREPVVSAQCPALYIGGNYSLWRPQTLHLATVGVGHADRAAVIVVVIKL